MSCQALNAPPAGVTAHLVAGSTTTMLAEGLPEGARLEFAASTDGPVLLSLEGVTGDAATAFELSAGQVDDLIARAARHVRIVTGDGDSLRVLAAGRAWERSGWSGECGRTQVVTRLVAGPPGPKGDPGADSTVPGPKGDPGEPGADGRGVESITDEDADGIATVLYTDGTTQPIRLPEPPDVSDLASKEELNNAISALPPVPSIELHWQDEFTSLKTSPMSVSYPDWGYAAEVGISGSIGSVIQAPWFQGFPLNPFLQVEYLPYGSDMGQPLNAVTTTIPLPSRLHSEDSGMYLPIDVSTPPITLFNVMTVSLLNESWESDGSAKATINIYGTVVSARWVDAPSGDLFAVVSGARHVTPEGSEVHYPGVIPIASSHEGPSGGVNAGPFEADDLGMIALPASDYVEVSASVSGAIHFPDAPAGTMITMCVTGDANNLTFQEGTVIVGQPSQAMPDTSFATLVKRVNGTWNVIWAQPTQDGVGA